MCKIINFDKYKKEKCYVCEKECEQDVLLFRNDIEKREGLKMCIDCFEEDLEMQKF